MATAPNWAEQLTAIATAVGAVGLLGAIVAAAFAGQQVREARKSRQAQVASEFVRRWSEDALVETRRLLDSFESPAELAIAFRSYVATGAPEAYVLYRELDFFEQLAALEDQEAFDFELIQKLLGRTLTARWEMWKPALDAVHGEGVYPMFRSLAAKMQEATSGTSRAG